MKKKPKDKQLVVANVKMSKEIRNELKARAKKYGEGNLSAWLRHAGLHYAPKRGEKVSLKAE